MRTWISTCHRSKSLAVSRWPSSSKQCIVVSTRLRRWYPLHSLLGRVTPYDVPKGSPRGAAEVSGGAQGIVAHDASDRNSLPRLRVLAKRDACMRTAIGDNIMTFARVAGTICRDAIDCLMLRGLVEKVG